MFTVLLGKKEEVIGEQDSLLSSGGLLWAGNAPPFPIAAIYIENYVPVPFTQGYLEFKGGMSHGWFGSNQFIKDYYMHHKYYYFQAGGKLPVHAHAGFHHFAQWGGTSRNPKVGKLPSDLKAFWKIFWANHGDSSENVPYGEILNRLGNHLGGWDFGIDFKTENFKSGLYWQTMFEDVFGLKWENKKDGLWGFYYKNNDNDKVVNEFVFEFIHTTNQSVKRDSTGKIIRGNDNYFNHSIYKPGWVYDEYVIGTPLISSPILNNNSLIYNNLVIAYHMGLTGRLFNNSDYKLKLTYSLNHGTNKIPFNKGKSTISSSLSISSPLKLYTPLLIKFEVAGDYGEMYGNNLGFLIVFDKRF
jgi:hypothetical protein